MNTFDRNAYIQKCKELGKSTTFQDATLKYAEHLLSQGLPVIFDIAHLSFLLNLDTRRLSANTSSYYKQFQIRKKSGGKRLILAPVGDLRRAQSWIYQNILKSVPLHISSHGFRNGFSIVSNAKDHVTKEVVLNLDLKSFFHSVYQRRVFGIFQSLGFTHGVSRILACLTTVSLPKRFHPKKGELPIFKPGMSVLPQGAPTSPALSNIAAKGLDARFAGYALKHNLVYTRYADDITFSGLKDNMPSISFLTQVVKEEGFWINFAKYRKRGRQHRQLVTGLIVNDGVRVSRSLKREVWTHLHFANKYGPFNHLDRRGIDKKAFRDWLLGKIFFIKAVEPEVAKKMIASFETIDWSFRVE